MVLTRAYQELEHSATAFNFRRCSYPAFPRRGPSEKDDRPTYRITLPSIELGFARRLKYALKCTMDNVSLAVLQRDAYQIDVPTRVLLLYSSVGGDDASGSGSQESATLLEMREAHAMIKDGLLRTITPDQVRTRCLLCSASPPWEQTALSERWDVMQYDTIHVNPSHSREHQTKSMR